MADLDGEISYKAVTILRLYTGAEIHEQYCDLSIEKSQHCS